MKLNDVYAKPLKDVVEELNLTDMKVHTDDDGEVRSMEDFLTDVYKNGYADGKESVPGVELQDVEKALQGVKGIGPIVWNRIKERLAELFRKEQS